MMLDRKKGGENILRKSLDFSRLFISAMPDDGDDYHDKSTIVLFGITESQPVAWSPSAHPFIPMSGVQIMGVDDITAL